MISVYITCKDEKEAENIAKHLLDLRLIACANMFPVKSMYWQDDKIKDENEMALIAKATDENFAAIVDEVKELHSYEVPCIVAWEWKDSSPDYKQWVENET